MDILIIETESGVISDLRTVLEKLGHSVVAVSSTGEEAISMVGDINPDLIIINIKLKGEMSGVEAAHKIKSLYNIPIIYLTSFIKNCLNMSLQVPEDAIIISLPIRQDHLKYAMERALTAN